MRLAELRKERKLTQGELGEKLNVAQNSISQWENGTRSIDSTILIKLADFYHVSIDYLLGYTPTRIKKPDMTIQENLSQRILSEADVDTAKEIEHYFDFLLSRKQKNEQT